jgi:ABC-2 type transport system permease protein
VGQTSGTAERPGQRPAGPGAASARLPRAGWLIVARKELADHLLSVRFTVLIVLLGLAAMLAVYAASSAIRDVAPQANEVPALFLRLFTVVPEDLPSFVSMVGLVGFLAPLLGIAFGFDSVSGERSQGTLPRLVAQPIYRDDVINGKFGAGLGVIGVVLVALTLIVAGLGLSRLGIVPTAEEVSRMLVWLVVTMVYVAFWLGFATLCSVALRRAATSALVAIAAWLVLALFWNLLVGLITNAVAPVPQQPTIEEQVRNLSFEQRFGRLSPSRLYEEVTFVILRPEENIGPYGFLLPQQLDRAVLSELSLGQSTLLVWPQIVGLVALTVICFAVAYVLFMRQEIRA